MNVSTKAVSGKREALHCTYYIIIFLGMISYCPDPELFSEAAQQAKLNTRDG